VTVEDMEVPELKVVAGWVVAVPMFVTTFKKDNAQGELLVGTLMRKEGVTVVVAVTVTMEEAITVVVDDPMRAMISRRDGALAVTDADSLMMTMEEAAEVEEAVAEEEQELAMISRKVRAHVVTGVDLAMMKMMEVVVAVDMVIEVAEATVMIGVIVVIAGDAEAGAAEGRVA